MVISLHTEVNKEATRSPNGKYVVYQQAPVSAQSYGALSKFLRARNYYSYSSKSLKAAPQNGGNNATMAQSMTLKDKVVKPRWPRSSCGCGG